MDLELMGLTALVTGASRGIGLAIAHGLAREGSCTSYRALRGISKQHALRYWASTRSRSNATRWT